MVEPSPCVPSPPDTMPHATAAAVPYAATFHEVTLEALAESGAYEVRRDNNEATTLFHPMPPQKIMKHHTCEKNSKKGSEQEKWKGAEMEA